MPRSKRFTSVIGGALNCRYGECVTSPEGSDERNGRQLQCQGAKYGISFGTALAIAISYTNNHSVLWAYHPTAFPMKGH